MVKVSQESEFQRLRQLADDYRRKGYRATIYPSKSELPAFLKGDTVDLLARGRGESVVVQVTTPGRLSGARHLERLADRIEGRSGWRFELVVAGSADPTRSGEPVEPAPGQEPLLRLEDVERRVAEAEALRNTGHPEAAHMLAWAAAEAIVRRVLDASALAVDPRLPGKGLKSLFSYGLVTKGDYDVLQAAFGQRNAIAHGFRPAEGKPLNTQAVIRVIRRLSRHAHSAGHGANGGRSRR